MKRALLLAAACALPIVAGVSARASKLGIPQPPPRVVEVEAEAEFEAQGAPLPPRVTVAPAPPVAPVPPGSNIAQFRDFEFTYLANAEGQNIKVNLDVKDATPREALKHVFDQTKLKHQVDEDVPDEPRLTLSVKGVRLPTAAALIAEAAGVNYAVERRLSLSGKGNPTVNVPLAVQDAQVVYRFGKKVPVSGRMLFGSGGGVPTMAEIFHDGGAFSVLTRTREERSTFNCPHCKGQTTMVRVKQKASCPKCSRLMQDDWQFCPADGTKRPAAPNEWRYCPICGKNVPAEKSALR
jgi:hypothetical protein